MSTAKSAEHAKVDFFTSGGMCFSWRRFGNNDSISPFPFSSTTTSTPHPFHRFSPETPARTTDAWREPPRTPPSRLQASPFQSQRLKMNQHQQLQTRTLHPQAEAEVGLPESPRTTLHVASAPVASLTRHRQLYFAAFRFCGFYTTTTNGSRRWCPP